MEEKRTRQHSREWLQKRYLKQKEEIKQLKAKLRVLKHLLKLKIKD